MCINAETSLISFIIGELCGLLLLTKSKEKQMIGLFIMFYTFVQLFEYNIYTDNNPELNSRLLLLNLGCQGILFFILMNQICDINYLFMILTIITLLFILIKVVNSDFSSASVNTCIKWNFMDEQISGALTIMYGLLFFWFYTNKHCDIQYDDFINNAGYFFTGTALLSFIISNRPNTPSFWCMSSALLAPIMLLL